MRNIKKKIGFLLLFLLVISWSIFLYFISPEKIINYFGDGNSYWIVFIAGLLGGISILFPFPYYIFVLTFAIGGLNPFLLGLFTGLGVILGESTSYWIGYTGRDVLPIKAKNIFNRISKYFNKDLTWRVPIFLFIYGSLSPLPNDVILIPLGMARYPFLKVIIPLGLGNIIYNILLAVAGFYGLTFFYQAFL